jgi:pyruvate dehydrogenase E1 component alpha subunit
MIAHEELLLIYRRMLRIRAFETRVGELHAAGEVPGLVHLSIGMEATAVGACAALAPGDRVVSTHRPHGHLLARDVPMRLLMAELLGRDTGTNRGRGGSMHASDFARGVLGANGIVGAGIPLAAGAALAAKVQGTGAVALGYFGDGAVATGAFHEGMTLAAALALPVIFLCENNLYTGGTLTEIITGQEDVAGRAEGYGIPAVSVDGNDVLAVYTAVADAVGRAREGGGPTLVEARTYRWSAQSGSGSDESRDPAEVAEWMERDPIGRIMVYLAAHGVADEPELARIAREVDEELTEAVEFARSSPPPPAGDALNDVYG